MKIAISLQHNEDFASIAELTIPVIARYAERHGYDFFPKKHDMNPEEIVWQRLDDVLELMPGYDAVVHLDADILITNPECRIDGLIMFDPNADYFCGEGPSGPNDGFSVWRCNDGGRRLIEFVMDHGSEYSSPQELLAHGYDSANKRRLHQRSCNSYLFAEYNMDSPLMEWKPGDFILHLPGIGNERRVQIIKEKMS